MHAKTDCITKPNIFQQLFDSLKKIKDILVNALYRNKKLTNLKFI